MRAAAALAALAAASAASCSSSGSELTCTQLASPTNCWASAAAAAAACIPLRASPAALASDRASCGYADGTTIVFDAPLPTDDTALDHLSFTVVAADGSTCASFTDTFANELELSAAGRPTVISELHPDQTFELDCGDGHTFSTTFGTLLTCPADAPTDGYQVDATSVTFTLVSSATAGPLFTCR
jgi:hypothetical protein|nr:hypothetical protein [Kofleriaceae bacterium]